MAFTLEKDWALIYDELPDREEYGSIWNENDVGPWAIVQYGENGCCGCSSPAMYDVIGSGATPEAAIAAAKECLDIWARSKAAKRETPEAITCTVCGFSVENYRHKRVDGEDHYAFKEFNEHLTSAHPPLIAVY